MFDALFEVDTKYTKFADKEYDAISAEVKKWFKKLVVSANVIELVHRLTGGGVGGVRRRKRRTIRSSRKRMPESSKLVSAQHCGHNQI